MKKYILIIAIALVTACASKPHEDPDARSTSAETTVKVSGTRVSREELGELKVIKVGNLLDQLQQQMSAYPQIQEGKTCKALIAELEANEIEVQAISDDKVFALTKDKKSLKYTFQEGGCL
ncbi:hypothetical protein QTP81_17000 [Alteromonas sp. ASW11-36]|uniref:Lipoprotein n=1 Tax=Alteromonas arenosi TaxID=3055817 RepID=A0ABT7T1J2_9ALTE|nr:hypothetical protein [Alteromonas sp. ASW11-36]MDM7862308.1 hypothetical protein [Alteromonas sp. ASW11-36]